MPRLCLLLAATLAVLATVAEAGFRSTCPSFQEGCTSSNQCEQCHPSCVFCQNMGTSTCGEEDCMTCLPGLHHIKIYSDATGVCVTRDNLYKDTCPSETTGCKPGNRCKQCHRSCAHCQGEIDTCGVKDCMDCQEGLKKYELFTDGTGECLPEGVHIEQHELTCPRGTPGCLADNRCVECHPHCDTCQNLDSITGICGADDCLSCREGHRLVRVHPDGRGECQPDPAAQHPVPPAVERSKSINTGQGRPEPPQRPAPNAQQAAPEPGAEAAAQAEATVGAGAEAAGSTESALPSGGNLLRAGVLFAGIALVAYLASRLLQRRAARRSADFKANK